MFIRETSIPGRANSKCKGPEVETRSTCLRNRKGVSVVPVEHGFWCPLYETSGLLTSLPSLTLVDSTRVRSLGATKCQALC